MKQRTKVIDWPMVHVNVNPAVLDRIEDAAERRALSVAAVVREALDASFRGRRSEAV
jgi:hypothetical protein